MPEKLTALYPLTKQESHYNAKTKYYPNGTMKVTCFNKPLFNPEHCELISKPLVSDIKEEAGALPWDGEILTSYYNNDRIRSDNIKRTRERIYDIAILNSDSWTHFVTLTLDKNKIDRYDSALVSVKFQRWLKNSVNRKELMYLIVPELHQDGAIHFHGLIRGDLKYEPSNTFVVPHYNKPVSASKVSQMGYSLESPEIQEVLNIKDYPFGYSTAIQLYGEPVNICKYITKYITKNSQRVFGNFYLAGGHGLHRDVPTDYARVDFAEAAGSALTVPNVKCKVKYITIGEL